MGAAPPPTGCGHTHRLLLAAFMSSKALLRDRRESAATASHAPTSLAPRPGKAPRRCTSHPHPVAVAGVSVGPASAVGAGASEVGAGTSILVTDESGGAIGTSGRVVGTSLSVAGTSGRVAGTSLVAGTSMGVVGTSLAVGTSTVGPASVPASITTGPPLRRSSIAVTE